MDIMDFLPALVVIVFVGALFFLMRELVMWYWKINRIVELQEQQVETLVEIYKLLKKDGESEDTGKAASHSKTYLAALQKKQNEGGESSAS